MNGFRVWLRFACVLPSLCLLCSGKSNQADTLADFLPTLHWDSTKSGLLIVVNAEHVKASAQGGNLQAFDRKLMTVGKMSAIVPTDRVLINDELTEPNMYDGLPREAKVLYLLSTLNSHQLDLVTTVGIGQHDLQGEQVKVLKSILPQPLAWKTVRVDEDESSGDDVDHGVVPSDQMEQVKLKIQNELEISLPLQSNRLAYRPVQASDMLGKPSDKVFLHDDSGPQKPFGADPKIIEPNKLKPSQLNYDDPRFGRTIQIPSEATIAALLKAIGSEFGMEIHAHLRVANLPIKVFGSEARACDLLKALALCVTGTYRKVGPAYVLTSDLVGTRVRQLRFAFWKGSADKLAYERMNAWKAVIGKSGALSKIGFDPNDPLAPDRRTLNLLNNPDSVDPSGDSSGQPGVTRMPTSELSPAIREFINRYAAANPSSGYVTDRVGLETMLQYAFVLPNGQPLHPERSPLGSPRYFRAWPSHKDQEANDLFKVDPAGKHPLIVRVRTEDEAIHAVESARAHGFTEVWLDAHRRSVLVAAMNRGVQVGLLIRPWEVFQAENLDRDVLGDSGTQLGIRRSAEPEWRSYLSAVGNGLEPAAPYDLVTPLESSLHRRWDSLIELARTTGLVGVVVLDTEPTGYEPSLNRANYGYYSQWMGMLHEFGYSDAMRLAFLRERSIDPIDIDEPELYLSIDLEQPFFPDYAYIHDGGDNDSTQDMRLMLADWCAYRAKVNQEAILPFIQQIKDVPTPMLVMPRLTAIHVPLETNLFVVPWTASEDFPKREPSQRDRMFSYAIEISSFNEESLPAVARALRWTLASPTAKVAIDMSSIPIKRLPFFLDRWFPKVEGK